MLIIEGCLIPNGAEFSGHKLGNFTRNSPNGALSTLFSNRLSSVDINIHKFTENLYNFLILKL